MSVVSPLEIAHPNGNELLAALPAQDLARLAPMLEPVQVEVGEVLSEPAAPIRHIYFPNDSLISLLAWPKGA